jgi:DNA-binding Lrp family transcriptional regulator
LLSELERAVISEVQRLPLTKKPFEEVASRLNIDENTVLNICKDLLQKGIIRRFGPSISHRKAGFNANPMTVINVPEKKVEEVGNIIASQPEVTHCYARSGWKYNLFFMIHGKTKEESIEKASSIVKKIGDFDYRILFSIQELKKTSFEIPKIQTEVKS